MQKSHPHAHHHHHPSAAAAPSRWTRYARGLGVVVVATWLLYLVLIAMSDGEAEQQQREQQRGSDVRGRWKVLPGAHGDTAGDADEGALTPMQLGAAQHPPTTGGDFDGNSAAGGPLLQSGPYRIASFRYRIPGIAQQHLDYASQCLGVWTFQHVLNRHIFYRRDGTRVVNHAGVTLPPAVAALDVPQAILENPQGGEVQQAGSYDDHTPFPTRIPAGARVPRKHDRPNTSSDDGGGGGGLPPPLPQWVSYADPRWNVWFREVFWPALFAATLPDVASNPQRPGIHYTCGNVLLENAPWCGMFSHEFSSFVFHPATLPEPVLYEYHDTHAAGGVQVRKVIPAESAATQPSRDAAIRTAQGYFRETSQRGQLNARDKQAIAGIRWRPMTEKRQKSDTSAEGDEAGESDEQPVRLDADELMDDKASGEVFLWRTQQRYPILLALRKPDRRAASTGNRFQGTFDPQKRLHGLHACFFGEMRNLSATMGSLEHDVFAQFRPMRTHFVTNDNVSQTTFVYKATTEPQPQTLSPAERANLGFLRKHILEKYTAEIMHLADTFLVTAGALHRVPTNCHHCRGALTKEMCRMAILSDLDRGYPVEYVLLFRPDAIIRAPFRLFVTLQSGKEVNLNITQDVEEALEGDPSNAQQLASMRLYAPEYRFSIVTDGGVTPAAMGLVSDVTFDPRTTVVVHSRVSYLLDMSWIADPVLFGAWGILNHWLELFSVHTSCPKHGWVDKYSGEWNQRSFYRDYLRPLFRLGYYGRSPEVQGLTVQLQPFDFMISLYRPHPLKNKVIFSTNIKNAPFQEQTFFKKFPLRWQYADCMYYTYSPRQTNVTVIFPKERFFFKGSVGKIRMVKVPMHLCSQAAVPPSIQNCFVQYQRMFYYKKGNNVNNPCKPYCNVFPIFMPEGLCLSIGSPGARNKNHATFSETPMWRNESGEVLKFNVVTPQYLIGDQAHKDRERAKQLQQERELLLAAARKNPPPPTGGAGAATVPGTSDAGDATASKKTTPKKGSSQEAATAARAVGRPRRRDEATDTADEPPLAADADADADDSGRPKQRAAARRTRAAPKKGSDDDDDDDAPAVANPNARGREAARQQRRQDVQRRTPAPDADRSSGSAGDSPAGKGGLDSGGEAPPANNDGSSGSGFVFDRPGGFQAAAAGAVNDEQVRKERAAALRLQGLNTPPKKYRSVKKP